jgi:hypothetical protein
MAVGDFTGHGNGVKDIAVTEYSGNTVRILRNVPPPPKPAGWACISDDQCQTGLHCVDHTCCALPDNALSCPSGQFCNIPGNLGTCSLPGPNGNPCDSTQQCQSPYCVGGFCCSAASCPSGEYCNSGDCAAPAPSGSPCSEDEQCVSGYCVNDVCCSARCLSSQACDIPGFEGQCTTLLLLGTACTNPDQCASGFCADGVCCDQVAYCPEGQACNLAGSPGECAYLPTATPTSTRTPTPTLTPTPVPIGGPCSAGTTLCYSPNLCVDGICCSTTCDPSQGLHCNITNFVGTCHVQLQDTSPCGLNTDCVSGYCLTPTPAASGTPGMGKCAEPPPTPTPTQTRTPTPLSAGDPCFVTSQCPSPLVCSADEHVCCMSSQCPTGQSCKLPGSLGWCTPIPTATATPTATPTVTPTPCDEASCEAQGQGWRCDITGYVGCSPPLAIGTPCAKTNDCEAALICNPDTGLCDYNSTPTVPPLPTATPTCGPSQVIINGVCAEVHVSRSGGCSIGDPSARGTAAPVTSAAGTDIWLVALLPLALGIRRLGRQEARASKDRPIRTASR